MQNNVAGKKAGKDLTQGSILKLLLTFALPMVLTSMIQQLYTMVDLIIIGQYVGSKGTVGVSAGSELSDLMTPMANAFGTAAHIYIAQLVGARDDERIKDTASTVITLMMAMSVVVMIVSLLFYMPILNALNCPEEAFSQAASYMIITACGMPFIFGYNVICSLLRGVGESKKPLYFIIVAATVNIFTDLLFVAVFKMESAGAALATVASQAGAFIAASVYFYKYREQFGFELKLSYFKIHKEPLKILLKLGIPQLIRAFSVHFSMLWVNANINSYGLVNSATYSVGNKVEKFMNVFIQGVNGAAGAMIGQNLGARKPERVRQTMWTTMRCTMVIGIVSASLFLLFPRPIYRIFTPDPDVIEYGVVFLRIMSVGCIMASFAGTIKSIATGAGAAFLCLLIGILDGVSRVAVCLFFFHVLKQGAASFFWGAALCHVIPGLLCLGYFLSGKWQTKKLLSEA